MRVKVGNKWYDSNAQPICIQISENEQKQIASIDRSIAIHGKYAVFPKTEKTTPEERVEWMKG